MNQGDRRKQRTEEHARWRSSIAGMLDRCAASRFHGQIRVVFFDGQVRQVVLEASHVTPDTLPQDALLPKE